MGNCCAPVKKDPDSLRTTTRRPPNAIVTTNENNPSLPSEDKANEKPMISVENKEATVLETESAHHHVKEVNGPVGA